MNISELEQWLDDFLVTSNDSENGTIDRNWTNAVEKLEKTLAEESDSIDKITMIRLLSKSLTAFNKLLMSDAIKNDLNLEQIVSSGRQFNGIDSVGYCLVACSLASPYF